MSKHFVQVCMGSSCFARGNINNLGILEDYIKVNNLDVEIDLVGAHCEDKCDLGPHIYVDGIQYDEVDEEKLKEILEVLK
mgnify:CR=1 FL=1